MPHSRAVVVVLFLASLAVVNAGAQFPSPLHGTWKLNPAKSTYDPATLAPKSGSIKVTVTGDKINAVGDGVDAQGRTTHFEYAARFDGKTYPVRYLIDGKTNPNIDGVSWKKIDNRTYEVTTMLKGKALVTSRVVVSADGKTRTDISTGKNAQGQAVNNKATFDRATSSSIATPSR